MADPSDPQEPYSPTPGASPAELTPPFSVGDSSGVARSRPGVWQPPEPGELQASFPQYEIRAVLGRGGMGAVYQGWQRSLDRLVAIKIFPPQLDGLEGNFAERFKREARAMARFSHPGIVAVHDAGETPDGLLYFVMEYIEGTDVQKMVRESGPLPPEYALAITAHVCDALAYAHERGVIHRDIKPSNIMVDREGRVKVADFGLAKVAADEAAAQMTGSDLRMGTPDFIAPEALLMGIGQVDQRADLYAVGVMLYQMLTGKVPRGMFEMPSVKRPELDPRFDAIVARAMQNDPEKRYGSATEIRTDLDKILSEPIPHRSGEIPRSGDLHSPNAPAAPEGRRLKTAEEAEGTKGRKADGRAAPSVARKSKWPLYGGIAAAAILASVAVFLWAKQSKPAGGPRSVAAQTSVGDDGGKAGGDEAPPSSAAPAATPAVVAATPVATTPKPATPAPAMAVQPSTPAPTAATPKPLSEIEKWLAQVDGIYQPMWQKEVIAPHEKARADLKKNMLAALDAQITAASRAAKLPDALAFRNERQRIESEQGVPADDSDTPPAALKTLRESYRAQVARLESERQKNATRIFEQYDKALATNQNALTQRQRLDEALLLQQRREALKAEWLAQPPKPGTPAVATKERPFVNSLGMKFVPVPITGGPTDGQRVLFSIWDTRKADFQKYAEGSSVGNNGWKNAEYKDVLVSSREDHPVVSVSWNDAIDFCTWLTQSEHASGKIGPSDKYRLPTDHEWSCAVGIGGREDASASPSKKNGSIKDEYPWGTQWPPPKGAGNFYDVAGHATFSSWMPISAGYEDGYPTTSPVGTFGANANGLFDLAGNVQQWCEDWFNVEHTGRVIRGSSWQNNVKTYLFSSVRANRPGNSTNSLVGFRCVLVLSASPAPLAPARNEPEPARPVLLDPAAARGSSPTPRAVAPATPPSTTPASSRPDSALNKATKEAPFTNTLGMKFVPVPGTKVLFCIHETRRQDYAVYAAAVPDLDGLWRVAWPELPVDAAVGHPVINVSYIDAQAFCSWLSKKEGRTYRLPSDREWSYAVGIGSEERRNRDERPDSLAQRLPDIFPWGSKFPPQSAEQVGNYSEANWKVNYSRGKAVAWDDGFPQTAPVMSFRPNKMGIYDLGGNVSEICDDTYSEDSIHRVLRGASWSDYSPFMLRSSCRSAIGPETRLETVGFRCVVEVPSP